MKIKITTPSNPVPNGTHTMAITEVVDLGNRPTKFGNRNQLKVIGVTDKIDPQTGQPYRIQQLFTASGDSRSKFFDLVRTATGRTPRPGEFDCNDLVGKQLLVATTQRVTPKGTFANIKSWQALPAGAPRIAIPLDSFTQQTTRTNDCADEAIAFPGY